MLAVLDRRPKLERIATASLVTSPLVVTPLSANRVLAWSPEVSDTRHSSAWERPRMRWVSAWASSRERMLTAAGPC